MAKLDLDALNGVEVNEEELSNVKDENGGFVKIDSAGKYKGLITKAYLEKNNFTEGNYDLMIQAKTEEGAMIDVKYGAIYADGKTPWKNKDDKFTVGANKIIALNMLATGAKGFPAAEVGKVEVYDFTEKEMVEKKKHIFPSLIGKDIGILAYPQVAYKQAKAEDGNYYPYADEKEEVVVERFLCPTTDVTFEEKKTDSEAIKAQVWLDSKGDGYVYDKRKAQLKKSKLSQPYPTKEDAEAVGGDDEATPEEDDDF